MMSEINITVKTTYLDEHSEPNNKRFAFAYTISIENCSTVATQLMSRYWLITDANNSIQEVQGEGVIGEQPLILPGEKYTYSSGAILETTGGTMEGSYTMQTLEGQVFDVPIPAFSLIHPQSLH
jgi:ApaG protein